MSANFYNVLNIHQNADDEVVRGAYRALAKKFGHDESRLRVLNDAYSILSNKNKRSDYDATFKKPTGKLFGDYRIISKIAEGGFGVTYKAEHLTLGTHVCIKHANNVSPLDEAILLDEAKAMWDLRHYGIPAMRDILRLPDSSLALVMSFIEGKTLAQIKEDNYENGIEAEHVAWISERILNILKYLHLHGVVHGDIKPQNVIVQPESHTVVLVDYGLSSLKPSSKTEVKGYTPYFAAPEQIAGKVPLPETDFFGLGMTMIYALGGDIEFVKVPSTTPDHMVAFIKKMIRREVLSRPNWSNEDLCESIKTVRQKDFGRDTSGMKLLKL